MPISVRFASHTNLDVTDDRSTGNLGFLQSVLHLEVLKHGFFLTVDVL